MPWAVIFSRKIWNPDLVIPTQLLFLIAFESLLRSYKPWKLYCFTAALAVYLQVHLLSLLSIIPIIIILAVRRLSIQLSQWMWATTLFVALFSPYIFFGIASEIAQIPSTLSLGVSQGLGFNYLLGDAGYNTFTEQYHLQWVSLSFFIYACIVIAACFWTLSDQYLKEPRSPATSILGFFAAWSTLLIYVLWQTGTVLIPQYWVSIKIIFPLCFGYAAQKALQALPSLWKTVLQLSILCIIGVQIFFMTSFYDFLEYFPQKITGDYGIPYILQK